MGIVAILSGGVFGGLTALISLLGFGAEWTDAGLAYLLSGTIFASAMMLSMSIATKSRQAHNVAKVAKGTTPLNANY